MAGEMISDAYVEPEAKTGEYASIEWDEKTRMWKVHNFMTDWDSHFYSHSTARDLFDTIEARGKIKAEEVACMVNNAIARNEHYGTW